MGGAENYNKGARKSFGDEVSVNEFWGLDPGDLPKPGDWVVLKTRAHELLEVVPHGTRPDTVRYKAIIRPLGELHRRQAAGSIRVFDSTSNIRGY